MAAHLRNDGLPNRAAENSSGQFAAQHCAMLGRRGASPQPVTDAAAGY